MPELEVEVKYYAMLREASGKRGESFELTDGSSVGDLLGMIVDKYGDSIRRFVYDSETRVRDYLSYMLNGVSVTSLEGFDTALSDGDVLAILPPIGGG